MSNIIKKFIYNKLNANKVKPKVKPSEDPNPNERITRYIETYDIRDHVPRNPDPNSSEIIVTRPDGTRILYDDRGTKNPMSQEAWKKLLYKLFMEDERRKQRSN